MYGHNLKCFFSALSLMFFISSINATGGHVYEYVLSGDQQVIKNIALTDHESGELAGRLELGLAMKLKEDTAILQLSFYLPDGLNRGYNSVFLFDDDYDVVNSLFALINSRSKQSNYRIHRNAPESVSAFFYSVVQMSPEREFEDYYKRFSDHLTLSLIIPYENYASLRDFGLLLQLYYLGRRNIFSGAFAPITIHITHRHEEDLRLPKPGDEVARDRGVARSGQETHLDYPTPSEKDDQVSDKDIARQPARLDVTPRESTPRENAFAESGVSDRAMELRFEKAKSLMNESREIYHAVMRKYNQPRDHIDDEILNSLKAYAEQLTQANQWFEEMSESSLPNLPGFESVQSNFLIYYHAAAQDINELTGEETVLPSRQEDPKAGFDRRRGGVGWSNVLLILVVVFLLFGGIIYLMKWRKKVRQKRLDKKIQRQANKELNKQKHMLKHKPNKQVKI